MSADRLQFVTMSATRCCRGSLLAGWRWRLLCQRMLAIFVILSYSAYDSEACDLLRNRLKGRYDLLSTGGGIPTSSKIQMYGVQYTSDADLVYVSGFYVTFPPNLPYIRKLDLVFVNPHFPGSGERYLFVEARTFRRHPGTLGSGGINQQGPCEDIPYWIVPVNVISASGGNVAMCIWYDQPSSEGCNMFQGNYHPL
jgi:hypothetical protein